MIPMKEKMLQLIVDPKEVDLPLYSYDRILAMGVDTLIIEMYDTIVGEFVSPAVDEVVKRLPRYPSGTRALTGMTTCA